MGSRPKRPVHVTTLEPALKRAAAWDQVSPPELVLDFTSPAASEPTSPERTPRERGGVKEAIIRWLEEQI